MCMGQLSAAELGKLAAMDEYDKMLAIDLISRQHGISAEDIERQISAHQKGGISAPTVVEQEEEVRFSEPMQTGAGSPTYINNPQQFRTKYDPSHDGQRRQTEIQQAILCPQCNSPLGIPSIRPIKVKCPNCDSENVFTN